MPPNNVVTRHQESWRRPASTARAIPRGSDTGGRWFESTVSAVGRSTNQHETITFPDAPWTWENDCKTISLHYPLHGLQFLMQLMVGNLTEEKASILDSNTELANKVLLWLLCMGHVIPLQNSVDFNITNCTSTAVKGEEWIHYWTREFHTQSTCTKLLKKMW